MKSIRRMLRTGLFAILFAGCQSGGGSGSAAWPLRIGVTADYPPMVFRQGGKLAGVEVDLAMKLGKALGRPIDFVETSWLELGNQLLAGKYDMVMSGLSITEARKVRIAFSDPYFETGLMAMFRQTDKDVFTNSAAILAWSGAIGVKPGTTGDVFVQQNCHNARRVALLNPADAAFELKRRRFDIFVHDAAAVAWLISASGATVGGLREMLTREELAWGFRPDDEALRADVNRILAGWKEDGTLDAILKRWMPYLFETK